MGKIASIIILMVILLLLEQGKFLDRKETPKPSTALGLINIKAEREFWAEQLDKEGGGKTYAEFKKQYADKNFATQHLAAHLFGQLLYQKLGADGIKICDSAFSYGCYHSFFGSAIADKGLSILPTLDNGCLNSTEGPVGCQHGIGHGLLEYLGVEKLSEALDSCKKLSKLNPYYGCASGVFMEYNVPIVIGENSATTTFRKFDKEGFYNPCPTVDQESQETCFYTLPQLWDKTFEKDYQEIANLCSAIANAINKKACFNGIGAVAAPSSGYEVGATVDKCNKIADLDGQTNCKITAAWSLYSLPEKKNEAFKICANLDPETKKKCPNNMQ